MRTQDLMLDFQIDTTRERQEPSYPFSRDGVPDECTQKWHDQKARVHRIAPIVQIPVSINYAEVEGRVVATQMEPEKYYTKAEVLAMNGGKFDSTKFEQCFDNGTSHFPPYFSGVDQGEECRIVSDDEKLIYGKCIGWRLKNA